jgi:PTS system nitrogen regulatory IIA component
MLPEVVGVEILTPKEAASLLKISEYTLLDYARKGKIPGRKIANRWRFSKEDLMDWFYAPVLDALLKEAEDEYREGKTVRLWPEEQ